jgi:hypothetical protein
MAEPARLVTTDDEIDQALERARKFEKYDRKVVRATYSKTTDRIRLELSDGSIHSIPRHLVQGLSAARGAELGRIQILNNGTGLLWPLLDVAHYVPGMLQGIYGSEKWMTALFKERKRLKLMKPRRTSSRRATP